MLFDVPHKSEFSLMYAQKVPIIGVGRKCIISLYLYDRQMFAQTFKSLTFPTARGLSQCSIGIYCFLVNFSLNYMFFYRRTMYSAFIISLFIFICTTLFISCNYRCTTHPDTSPMGTYTT
uniref:Uncharacterized protein n=1 Tax=Sipha flava TaxID=143950 RepID=A0A2S2QJ18_9HEMI